MARLTQGKRILDRDTKTRLMSDIDHVEQEALNYFRSKLGSNVYNYVKRFSYGDVYFADVRITVITGSATRVDVPVKKGLVNFSANFRSGSHSYFRIDNEGNAPRISFSLTKRVSAIQ